MNSSMLRRAAVAGLILALTGCYQKHLVFQAEAVSMTRQDAAAAKSLKVGEPVEAKWCISDGPVHNPDGSKDVGLADQVIWKAQDGGKRADYIIDARIWRDTDGCAILTGKIARL